MIEPAAFYPLGKEGKSEILRLEVNLSREYYAYLFFIVAGIFAPCFFLAGLPAGEQKMELENHPPLLKVLLLYIVIPLLILYMAILYIYFIQSLVTLEWPKGTVSHLVLWYSAFSAVVLFLLYPLVQENKYIRLFFTWFPKLALPAILVMFAAIGIRIHAYGVTENRYFVVALGLWVFAVMLYDSLARRFRNTVLPVSLAIVALLSVFGPWSAYSLSKFSQNARFEALVAKYNMVDGDTLQMPDRVIADEDKREIVSILDYFSRYHSLDEIRLLPSGFKYDDMRRVFGFSREDTWRPPVWHFSFYSQVGPVDLRGYDYLVSSASLISGPISLDGLKIKYLPENLKLVILRGDEEIYVSDLEAYGRKILELHGAVPGEVPVEDMTFVDGNENVQVKLLFTGIFGEREPGNGKLEIYSMEFYLLLKK